MAISGAQSQGLGIKAYSVQMNQPKKPKEKIPDELQPTQIFKRREYFLHEQSKAAKQLRLEHGLEGRKGSLFELNQLWEGEGIPRWK